MCFNGLSLVLNKTFEMEEDYNEMEAILYSLVAEADAQEKKKAIRTLYPKKQKKTKKQQKPPSQQWRLVKKNKANEIDRLKALVLRKVLNRTQDLPCFNLPTTSYTPQAKQSMNSRWALYMIREQSTRKRIQEQANLMNYITQLIEEYTHTDLWAELWQYYDWLIANNKSECWYGGPEYSLSARDEEAEAIANSIYKKMMNLC